MNSSVRILPLPESTGFVTGFYGLEACYFRGIVRIHLMEHISIKELKLSVQGRLDTTFLHTHSDISANSRTKILYSQEFVLLQDIELEHLEYFDVPFEVQIQLHDPISNGFGPCSELLAGSTSIVGGDNYKQYSAKVYYTVKSKLKLTTPIPFYYSIQEAVVNVPLKVYDPRLLCGMLNPEQRIWKSHVGQAPLEYDIFINSCVYGPKDVLELSYMLMIDDKYAQKGVRVQRVSLIIKEIHIVGEGRCCRRDDDPSLWYHGSPIRVRGSKEILNWSTVEYPPPDNPYPRQKIARFSSSGKYHGLATNPQYSTSDGIYVKRTVKITMPDLSKFTPSTGRIIYPPDDYICKNLNPRDSFLQVRHVVQVSVELKYGETFTVDAIVYMSSISKERCQFLLQTEGEVVPTLDYEKVVGLDAWVPEYKEKDPLSIVLDSPIFRETIECNERGDISQPSDDCSSQSSASIQHSVGNSYDQLEVIRTALPSSAPPLYEELDLDLESLVSEAMNDSLV
jgi:hypothetical protein